MPHHYGCSSTSTGPDDLHGSSHDTASVTHLDEKCQGRPLIASLEGPQPLRQSEITSTSRKEAPDIMPLQQPARSARTSMRQSYDPERYSLPSEKYQSILSHEANEASRRQHEAMRLLKKDLGALVNFMSIIPFISIATALYAFFAVIAVLILAPLNACVKTRAPIAAQLRRFLVPATNLHYKCAWSSSRATTANVHRSWPGSIHTDISDTELQQPVHTADAPSNSLLLFVLFVSPLLAIPMAFAALVVALWWIMSAITANDVADGFSEDRPKKEGQGGFDEGQRLARGLRQWWIGWLSGDKLR